MRYDQLTRSNQHFSINISSIEIVLLSSLLFPLANWIKIFPFMFQVAIINFFQNDQSILCNNVIRFSEMIRKQQFPQSTRACSLIFNRCSTSFQAWKIYSNDRVLFPDFMINIFPQKKKYVFDYRLKRIMLQSVGGKNKRRGEPTK